MSAINPQSRWREGNRSAELILSTSLRMTTEMALVSTTFTVNSTGMFLEGARNLALQFLSDVVEAAPEKLTALITEPKP